MRKKVEDCILGHEAFLVRKVDGSRKLVMEPLQKVDLIFHPLNQLTVGHLQNNHST